MLSSSYYAKNYANIIDTSLFKSPDVERLPAGAWKFNLHVGCINATLRKVSEVEGSPIFLFCDGIKIYTWETSGPKNKNSSRYCKMYHTSC